ncbi:hypothetical protein [Streptomyces iakyrus]
MASSTPMTSRIRESYAHQIAHRDAQKHPGVRGVVRAVLAEWPLGSVSPR